MKGLEIARRRMRNSRLIGPAFDTPDEAVRWHGAIQAQDYGPAKWSIGQRSRDLVDADVDRALAEGEIIRTHVLRPTWHFVARDDIRWLLALTGPRVQRSTAARYRDLGLDAATLARCEVAILSALDGRNRLTRDEIAGALDAAGIDRSGQRLPHIIMHCELEAAICSGGLSGKQQTYAAFDERVAAGPRFDRDDALIEVVRRYLTSHGPATVQDLRWWSSLTVADVRTALEMLGSEVRRETTGEVTFWSMRSEPSSRPRSRDVELLQAYDELLVGYRQSRYFGDPRAVDARAAWKDRTVPSGVMLSGGGVAGHWRRTIDKDSLRIEAVMYEQPSSQGARALRRAAQRLGDFLGRRVIVESVRS